MPIINNGGGDSPLLQAIRLHLPENVNTLLEAGADPNGLPNWILSDSVTISTASLGYQRPDTPGNIHPFWSSAMSNFQVNKLAIQAVVAIEAAAGEGLDDTIDQLVAHGADISCWKAVPPPDEPSPSSLSASSPLHAAITGRHNTTVAHLLAPPLSLNPNFIPPGPPSATRTPDFNVHLAHFAAALLSVSLLRQLPNALRAAGTTTRGHTLLHVACMPRDETHINVFAPRVHQSVRFVSMLDPAWKQTRLHATCPQRAHVLAPDARVLAPELEPPLFGKQDERFFDAQVEVLVFLRETVGHVEHNEEKGEEEGEESRARKGMKDLVRQRDVDGNTALHFLAGYRTVNMRAVEILRAADEDGDEGGRGTWETAKNRWGFTPRDLFEAGKQATEARHMKFWGEDFGDDADADPRMPCYGCASLPGARGRGRGRG
ncbi:hypothetical protein B0H13DRAFT_1957420 [Mycena leptocephala]|nr:hypothetical protein B0H13DRAFT_1957420 [Mycena leptocephala]